MLVARDIFEEDGAAPVGMVGARLSTLLAAAEVAPDDRELIEYQLLIDQHVRQVERAPAAPPQNETHESMLESAARAVAGCEHKWRTQALDPWRKPLDREKCADCGKLLP